MLFFKWSFCVSIYRVLKSLKNVHVQFLYFWTSPGVVQVAAKKNLTRSVQWFWHLFDANMILWSLKENTVSSAPKQKIQEPNVVHPTAAPPPHSIIYKWKNLRETFKFTFQYTAASTLYLKYCTQASVILCLSKYWIGYKS